MQMQQRLEQFVQNFLKEEIVQKNIYDKEWLSGCCTTVKPIMVWRESIEFQWKSDRKIFDKFINRIVAQNSDLFKYGYFSKSDGSCPSSIVFYFNKPLS